MTDQDAMLKLARAVYPDVDWMGYEEDGKNYACDVHTGDFVFDPANNDSQAVAVLCWLLDRDANNSISKGCILYVATDATGWAKRAEYFHDLASFRAAVTKAALRVVG